MSRVLVISLVSACLLAACGSSHRSSGTTSTSDGPGTTSRGGGPPTTPTVVLPTATTISKGKVVPKPTTPTTLPRETPTQAIGPDSEAGQQVLIKSNAIWPEYLYPTYTYSITWTNLSGKTQIISFYHYPLSSPPIPPGGQWIWKASSAGVLGYHDSSGAEGLLNLQAPTPIVTP
jgi:hypothetical protein